MSVKPILFFAFSALLFTAACSNDSGEIVYPETRQGDDTDTYFGTEVADPYRWLEDDRSDETADWVSRQNDLTFGYLNRIPFRSQVEERITQLWDYERVSSPTRHGDYYYFSRNDGLQNHSVIYRTAGDADDAEIYLDPNTFSEDGTTSLAGLSFTRDGSRSVHAISIGGSDWREVITMDTETGEVIGDTLRNVKFSGLAWNGTEGFSTAAMNFRTEVSFRP